MGASDSKQLQLQISASAELLIRNLKQADNAIADFQRETDSRLTKVDARFAALGNLKGKLAGLDRGIGIGDVLGAATGVTLIQLASHGLEYASSLGEVSQQLGVTTRDLQTYRYAATQTGIDQEVMDKGLAKLTATMGKASLGAKEPTKAFNAIGISLDQLKGKTAGDVIPLIADGLTRISDPAQRAAIEMAIFGKAGQQLDTLLAGGSGQINELARAAQDLGLVLSDDQIQKADATADKLAEVKQVLEAEIAGTVAENAGAITALATSLGNLTSAMLGFLNANPQAAIGLLGALAGGRVGGGPGALIGGALGVVGGEMVSRTRDDQNADVTFRRQELARARRELAVKEQGAAPDDGIGLLWTNYRLRRPASRRAGADAASARREVARQEGLLTSAEAAVNRPKPKPVPGVDVPQFLASEGGKKKGKSAEQLAREAEAAARRDRGQQRSANSMISRAELDVLGARADLSDDPEQRLRIEEQRIDLARQGRDADLEDQAIDNRYIAANLDRLKKLNAEGADLDKQALNARRAQDSERALNEQRQAEADDAIALLEIQAGLTVISRDRRAIEARILDHRQEEERRALAAIVQDNSGAFTPEQRTTAQQALDRLPERQAAQRQELARDQAGPLAQYRDQLLKNVGDMDEALEGVAARGIQSVEDGLVGIITGTQSVGDAFKSMADAIISDLVRIMVQKLIVNAIGTSVFGFADGGEVPAFADGGLLSGPGGPRSDSIIARVSAGEFIMNARATQRHLPLLEAMNNGHLPAFADGGVVGARTLPSFQAARLPDLSATGRREPQQVELTGNIRVSPTREFDARMEQLSWRTVGQAAEPIMAGAEGRTMKRLRRQGLPGAPG